jgi:hypothetical protein
MFIAKFAMLPDDKSGDILRLLIASTRVSKDSDFERK